MNPPFAVAQDQEDTNKAAARRLATEAGEHFDRGEYEPAFDLFHRANTLFPAPTLAVWEAKCLEKLDRLLEAEEIFVQLSRAELTPTATEPYRNAIAEAIAGVERLRATIPTVLITLVGADPNDPAVRVLLDGKQLSPALVGVPVPMNPGRHTIAASVRGGQNDLRAVDAERGTKQEIKLILGEPPTEPVVAAEPQPEPKVEPQPPTEDAAPIPTTDEADGSTTDGWTIAGWTGVGIGALGVGVGIGTGIVAIVAREHAFESCTSTPCNDSNVQLWRSMTTASTVGYVAGGIVLAAGIATLIFKPAATDVGNGVSVYPWVTVNGGGIGGTF